MTEECPNCETDVLVSGAGNRHHQWKCHGCDERFGHVAMEPVDFDAADQWFEGRSPYARHLHTDRNCPAGDHVIIHTPAEAAEHRHPRCLTCAHEVVE